LEDLSFDEENPKEGGQIVNSCSKGELGTLSDQIAKGLFELE